MYRKLALLCLVTAAGVALVTGSVVANQPGDGQISVDATDDGTTAGGNLTIAVNATDVGSVRITDIPNDWTVTSSQDDGAFIDADGQGDDVKDSGQVTWAWGSDQAGVDVAVTMSVPANASVADHVLAVNASNGAGQNASTTAVASVLATPPPTVSADGGRTVPGGSVSVTVDAARVGSVNVSQIPGNWSVASSQDDGAATGPSGGGDRIASEGNVVWTWSSDRRTVNVSVTLDVPATAVAGTNVVLDVRARNASGTTAEGQAAVQIEACNRGPAVCLYDTNGNGIDTGELQAAIQDFLDHKLGTPGLQAIIQSFLSTPGA